MLAGIQQLMQLLEGPAEDLGGSIVGVPVRRSGNNPMRRCPLGYRGGEAMRYMLLICGDESIEVSPEEASAIPWLEEVASKHPVARFGAVEVRPLWTE